MPIKTNLNSSPYFDDFDITKQFHRILFKPAYAVQARELTQLQTILQNQIEQFGSNIYQEGSIIKGCTFTQLNRLKFVKVKNKLGFDIADYVGGEEDGLEVKYEIVGQLSELRGEVIAATRGFETRAPDLNTFYFEYLNTGLSEVKRFILGEELKIIKNVWEGSIYRDDLSGEIETIEITSNSSVGTDENNNSLEHEGSAYGLSVSEGIIFQRGHFLFADQQTIIISKYNNFPDNVSVGYNVSEQLITTFQDASLYDNARGFPNENAPGADRLKLVPVLTSMSSDSTEVQNSSFFSLITYENGNPILIRNVSQFNSIAEEMARRTFEESGNYIASNFSTKLIQRNDSVKLTVGPGVAYVKGYRIENSGERIFDIEPVSDDITDNRNAQATSVEMGRYYPITSITGTVNLNDYVARTNLRNSSNTIIGTAFVKNIYDNEVQLFDIRMSNPSTNFSSVARITGPGGFITISPVLKGKGNSSLIIDTGTTNIKSITDTIIVERRLSTGVAASGSVITLNAGTDEDFACDNENIIVVDSTNVKRAVSSTSLSLDNKTLTINLGSSPSGNSYVYYNIRMTNLSPFYKTSKRVFVKVSYENAVSKYSLGLPDVYELISIKDTSDVDYTNSFKLISNQRDDFYDLSYIQTKSNEPLPADGLLLVEVDVYEQQTSTGLPYFTVDSYNNVTSDKIPLYETSEGKILNLRNCYDFRPFRTPTVAYQTDSSLAPTVANAYDVTPEFVSRNYIIPAKNNYIVSDIEYYLTRYDSVAIDSHGKFSIIRGQESLNPVAPTVDNDKLIIAEIFVPSNILLSPNNVAASKAPGYVPTIISRGVRNYTMKNIDDINKQVKRMVYYMSLNLLEVSTQRLNVYDENGLSRFKNGILVDPFNDLTIADVADPEFNASVDYSEHTLAPSVVTIPMNLIASGNSGAEYYPNTGADPEIATIETTRSDRILLRQRNATSFRSCTSNFWSYNGTGQIHPEYDGAYNTTTTPARIDLDIATPFTQLVSSLQEFVPLTRTTSTLVSSSTNTSTSTTLPTTGKTGSTAGSTSTTTQTTEVFNDVVRSLQLMETSRTQAVGDFVTNFEFLPYMRSRVVRILMYGLRPNTRHYAFFDQVPVNEHVQPGTFNGDPNDPSNIVRAAAYGRPLVSDSNGVIRCRFKIPPNTFFVGERDFELMDVDLYSSRDSASSSRGFVRYNAYNFSVQRSALSVSTRSVIPSIQETTTTRVVEGRPVTVTTPIPAETVPTMGEFTDPLAQTFFIKEGMVRGTGNVFVSKIAVYFKRKSNTNGVTLELREVQNGFPTSSVVPFGRKHLTSAEVNTSDNSSVATIFEFSAPIKLNAETEYCFSIKPDANDPEYLLFTTKPGLPDLMTGEQINSDWGDGVLFSSTNNRTWTSYQDEDAKFIVYAYEFDTDNATVTMSVDNPEFFTLTDIVGTYQEAEEIYAEKGSSIAATISNKTITSLSTLSSVYSENDSILLISGSNTEIATVTSVLTNSLTIDAPSDFSGSIDIKPIISATIQYYSTKRPTFMYVEKSSAKTGRLFEVDDVIIGHSSGTTSTIQSIDNSEISYTQAMINRTNSLQTSIDLSGSFTDDAGTIYSKRLDFGAQNSFNNRKGILYSKSNNLLITPSKQFNHICTLKNTSNSVTTPFLDIGGANLLAYKYQITNNETTTSKYISKIVELVEDFDAEDFMLYLGAYKPETTDIKVYLKVQHKGDPLSFKENDWIELELKEGIGLYSSINNLNDFKEYVYKVPETNKSDDVITYANTTGTYSGYRKFAIKISMLSENISIVPRISDYRGIALT